MPSSADTQLMDQSIFWNTLERPIGSDALKRLITKIEKEMTRRSRNPTGNLPINRVHQMGIGTYDLVEFAPTWRRLAVPALPAIPPLVVGCSQAIPSTIHETKDAFIVLRKGGELKRIQQEAEKHIMT